MQSILKLSCLNVQLATDKLLDLAGSPDVGRLD